MTLLGEKVSGLVNASRRLISICTARDIEQLRIEESTRCVLLSQTTLEHLPPSSTSGPLQPTSIISHTTEALKDVPPTYRLPLYHVQLDLVELYRSLPL